MPSFLSDPATIQKKQETIPEFLAYLEALAKLYHFAQNELGRTRTQSLFSFAFSGTGFENIPFSGDGLLFEPNDLKSSLSSFKSVTQKRSDYTHALALVISQLCFYLGEKQTLTFVETLLKNLKTIYGVVIPIENFLTRKPNKTQNVGLLFLKRMLDAAFISRTRTAKRTASMIMQEQAPSRFLLQVEDELLTKYTQLKEIFMSLPNATIAVDQDYVIVFASEQAEKLLGKASHLLYGEKIDSVVTLIENNKIITALDYIPLQAQVPTQQLYFGERLLLQSAQQPNTFVNVVTTKLKPTVANDTVALVTLYPIEHNSTLQANQVDIVSITAHELKSPLTSMRGYLAMLEDDLGDKLTKDEQLFLTRMAIATNQIITLIGNLLSFAKIENKTLTLQRQTAQLEDVIESAMADVRANIQKKQITVLFNKPHQKLPMIAIDVVRVKEVLTNLLTNAVNYSPQASTVTISAFQDDGFLVVEVSDHGIGIPEEAIPKLFTKFYQVQSEKQQEVKGTGLGLYIAKEIITAHGGSIWVHSRLEEGSTFSFRLPVHEPKMTAPRKAVDTNPPPTHRYFQSAGTPLLPLLN